MRASEAISERRTIKRFTNQAVSQEDLTSILATATLAPNHRLTQPWRFYVLGPEARYAYGFALGNRKAKKIEDPAAAQKMRETMAEEHRALPVMLAVAMTVSENEEIREEDYAAVMMSVQNVCVLAVEKGLGTALKSGAVLGDPAARTAVGVKENERIVVVVNMGTPAEAPGARTRLPGESFISWVP